MGRSTRHSGGGGGVAPHDDAHGTGVTILHTLHTPSSARDLDLRADAYTMPCHIKGTQKWHVCETDTLGGIYSAHVLQVPLTRYDRKVFFTILLLLIGAIPIIEPIYISERPRESPPVCPVGGEP